MTQKQMSTGRVEAPARAAQLILEAHRAVQQAQQVSAAVIEAVRAALGVEAGWQLQQEGDGSLVFVETSGE